MTVGVVNSALEVRVLVELGCTGGGSSVLFGVSLFDPEALCNSDAKIFLSCPTNLHSVYISLAYIPFSCGQDLQNVAPPYNICTFRNPLLGIHHTVHTFSS